MSDIFRVSQTQCTYLNFFRVVHILQSELVLVMKSELVDLVLQLYHQGVFVLKVAPCDQNFLFVSSSHMVGRNVTHWGRRCRLRIVFSQKQ